MRVRPSPVLVELILSVLNLVVALMLAVLYGPGLVPFVLGSVGLIGLFRLGVRWMWQRNRG